MNTSITIKEEEFIEAIDANFHFETLAEYHQTVHIACTISDNAALMIGYELASGCCDLELSVQLLQQLQQERPTDVILKAVEIIASLITHQPINEQELRAFLKLCREHPGSYNGLCIIELANQAMEEMCEQIRFEWKNTVIEHA